MLFFACMFVHCMFVCLYFCVCHAGCPGKRSRRSTTYNVTVCRSISMWFALLFHRKKRPFQPSAEISTISLGGATIFDGIGENFENLSKSDGKVSEHDLDHLGAAYNNSFIRPL